MQRGYLYIAIGDRYAKQFAASLRWLRRSDHTTPVAVISDTLTESSAYTLIPSSAIAGFETRALKTSLDLLTPFDQTLYMDTDTLAITSPANAFAYLDAAAFAIAPDDELTVGGRVNVDITPWHIDYLGAEEIKDCQGYPADTPYYNTGVMAWTKGQASSALFLHWRKEWERFRKTDQLALSRALHDGQHTIAVLPKTFNLSHTSPKAADPDTAKLSGVTLIHFWLYGENKMAEWSTRN